MRLIDADALRKNAQHAKDISRWYGELLVVGLGHILNAPTIESPRPDWTPCAEGLPKTCGKYECTISERTISGWCGTEPELYTADRYFNDGKWYQGDERDYDVIAWMPKHAPYNPDRKEDAK